jgi:hypothetical protein
MKNNASTFVDLSRSDREYRSSERVRGRTHARSKALGTAVAWALALTCTSVHANTGANAPASATVPAQVWHSDDSFAPINAIAPIEFVSSQVPFLDLWPSSTQGDLWQRVRRGFAMAEMDSPLVQSNELMYANRAEDVKRLVQRGSRYLFHIVEEVERRGLPTEIALLPIIESAFNPQAYSRAHASGMWQFIPSTGKNFGLNQDWMTDDRRDVLLSTSAALDYLAKLYGMFNSWELAFAAYNCGEGCVGRAIQRNQRQGLPTDFLNLNLPNETRAYVPRLIAVRNIILSPGSYGVDLPPLENRPYFTQVSAPEKIDVKLAARLAEMEDNDFAALNPSFNKPVARSGSGYFLVPTEKAIAFKTNLDLYRSLNAPMVSWVAVTAKKGESVDAVAKRHGMTASYLRALQGTQRPLHTARHLHGAKWQRREGDQCGLRTKISTTTRARHQQDHCGRRCTSREKHAATRDAREFAASRQCSVGHRCHGRFQCRSSPCARARASDTDKHTSGCKNREQRIASQRCASHTSYAHGIHRAARRHAFLHRQARQHGAERFESDESTREQFRASRAKTCAATNAFTRERRHARRGECECRYTAVCRCRCGAGFYHGTRSPRLRAPCRCAFSHDS